MLRMTNDNNVNLTWLHIIKLINNKTPPKKRTKNFYVLLVDH